MRQLAEWGAALTRANRPPCCVVRAAKAAFAQRVAPADLAPLIYDSDIDGPAAARPARGPARGPARRTVCGSGPGRPAGALPGVEARRLWFGADGRGIELMVEPPACGTRALCGRLMPPDAAAVVLLLGGGDPVPLPVDGGGRFTADGVRPGLLRLRVDHPGRRHLTTAWILLE